MTLVLEGETCCALVLVELLCTLELLGVLAVAVVVAGALIGEMLGGGET